MSNTLQQPNLCVIGAMKSGTTSLNAYLGSHPDIFMSDFKEPGYFVPEIAWEKGINWYLNLFENSKNEKIIGEASTHYTKLPCYQGVPDRIFSYNPEMKFIYVMRDPIKRSISHYWHNVRLSGERGKILAAIQNNNDYINFSHYAMQLKPYLDIFGKENVFILTHEEMISYPIETLQKIFAWLKVDSLFIPPNINEAKYVTPQEIGQARGFGILHQFRQSDFWDSLHNFIPANIRTLGRKFAEKKIDKNYVSTGEVINYLRPIQQEQTITLSKLLGRNFHEWTTLFADN